MDLTRTCPTCSHIEDGSSLTCSFCGVELALNSENLPDTQVIDLSAGDEYIADDQVRDIQEEPSIEGPVPKPESLDAAIAHVLGAEPIADLLEEVEPSKPANPADGHSPHPEKTSAPSESRPNPLDPGPAVEGESNEGIVLPESVQLKSEDRADRVSAALNPGPAEAAAGT